ncbi:MAG: heavy metal translocating P-type ATPase, partial [Candidatus Kapabacteria bacterium]|nr:heavy metal translocating P-type ATPase [Candidatus Kapabacteria bacterium]
SCVRVLEQLYAHHDGILRSEVNFPRKEVHIMFNRDAISLRRIVEILVDTGYTPELTLQATQKGAIANKTGRVNDLRSLYVKTGIAGFAFANVMLLSAPAYLSEISVDGAILEASLKNLFAWLSIAISLPVLVYSASDYFVQSYRSVMQRRFSLDIPIMLGITALFTRSAVEIALDAGSGYLDSFTGLVFFLLIAKVIQAKSFESLRFDREFSSLFPLSITKISNGVEQSVAIASLKPNDELRIHNGELIPADSVLESAFARIDNSFITGEAEPLEILRGMSVYAGARLVGASAKFRVVKDVSNSHLHGLWAAVETEERKRPWLLDVSDAFARYFTLIVTVLAAATAIWWYPNLTMMLNATTAVLIVACPCALTLATPFALGAAMNVLARLDFYCKRPDVVFDLAGIDTAVFDKTGTLMESTPLSVTWSGDEALSSHEWDMLYAVCQSSAHPLSRAVALHCKERGASVFHGTVNVKEIAGEGLLAILDSATILFGSRDLLVHHGVSVPVLTNASSSVSLAWDGVFKGMFTIDHTLRSGADLMLQSIQSQSGATVDVHCISGDSAKDMPLVGRHIPESHIRFGMSPQEKSQYITTLQAKGKRVAMIGDGINDTGALRTANIGIAVSDKTASFTPASDVIVSASSLRKFDSIINFSRSAVHTLIAAFALSVVYNIIGMWLAMTGALSPMVAALFMPVSSWSVVGVAYGVVRWRGYILRRALQ